MLSENDLANLLCIPAHYRGFAPLVTCLNLAMKDEYLLNPFVKRLYPLVAERHGTTVCHIISSIRNLVKIWWKRGNRSFLPYYITSAGKPPGNREFIYVLVAYLQHTQNK